MGLDMYLNARKYVEKLDWKKLHDNTGMDYKDATLPDFNSIVSTAGLADLATDIYGASVSVTALYWRKANQIHNWFVDNVQQGNDDCKNYYVSHEKLNELLSVCEEALVKIDPSLLPPVEGFFFGGTDIDQYYWEEIKRTIKGLKRIMKHKDYDRLSFYYDSSW
jgi:hypothetical protein